MSLFAASSKLSARTLRLAQQHSAALRTSTPAPTSTSHLTFTRNFHLSPANMTVTKITTKEDYYKLIESTRPGAAAASGEAHKSLVIIDAFAVWCGPCKMIAPEVEKLSEKHGAKAHFIQIDVDDLPDVAQELSIRAMPTFKVFKDGEPFDSLIGAHPGKLNDLVEKAVATVA